MFRIYVASVSYSYCKNRSRCCICCNGYICMLQVSVQNISHVFRCMLQVLVSGCCICFTHVASICSKYFSYFRRRLHQVFYVSSVYCWMGQTDSRSMHPQVGAWIPACAQKMEQVRAVHTSVRETEGRRRSSHVAGGESRVNGAGSPCVRAKWSRHRRSSREHRKQSM